MVNICLYLGNIATRDCGPTAAGLAYWSCNHEGRWMTGLPDLSQCQSHWLQKLRGQLDRGANRQASIVHVAHDLAHYTSNFGPLLPGDLLLLIDTIESMTSRMRDDLRTIPTLDQKRAVITQVVQVKDSLTAAHYSQFYNREPSEVFFPPFYLSVIGGRSAFPAFFRIRKKEILRMPFSTKLSLIL